MNAPLPLALCAGLAADPQDPAGPLDAPVPAAWQMHPARRLQQGQAPQAVDEALAEESPVALVLNGISHAVMLATPADLADFGLGFCLSEGLIDTVQELRGLDIVPGPEGLELRLELSPRRAEALRQRRRSLAGRTGCGLCGVESLAALRRTLDPVPPGEPVAAEAVARALAALQAEQPLFARTGAVHAAAWADAAGRLLCVREDVGRHNALDKLIGARGAAGARFDRGFALLTSRASVEMVQKLASVGGGLLAAVSAPTALALRSAEALQMSLVGFARGTRLTVYTHPRRLGLPA